MLLIKNTKVGNLNKVIVNFIIFIFFTQISYSQISDNFIGAKTNIKVLDKISSKMNY